MAAGGETSGSDSFEAIAARVREQVSELTREQLAAFGKRLNIIGTELARMNAKYDAAHADVAAAIDGIGREVRALVGTGLASPHAPWCPDAADDRFSAVDGRTMKELLDALHVQICTVQRELLLHMQDLELALERETEERCMGHLALERRCDDLGSSADMLNAVGALEGSTHQQGSDLDDRIRRLESDAGGAAAQNAALRQLILRHVADEAASRTERWRMHEEGIESRLREERLSLQAYQNSVQEQFGETGKVIGTTVDQQSRDLRSAHQRLDSLQGRLVEHDSRLAHHASMEERMHSIHNVFGDELTGAVAELRESVEQVNHRMRSLEARSTQREPRVAFEGVADNETACSRFHHMMDRRVGLCESLVDASIATHGKTLEALVIGHAQHSSDVEVIKARFAKYDTVAEWCTFIASALRESACKAAGELVDVRGRFEDAINSASDLQGSSSPAAAHRLQPIPLHGGAAVDAQHALLKEHIDRLRGMLRDSSAKPACAAATKLRVAGGHSQGSPGVAAGEAVAARCGLEDARAGPEGGVEHPGAEKGALDNAAPARAEAACGSHACARHESLLRRVDHLENVLGDSVTSHTHELGMLDGRLDQLHARVLACERLAAPPACRAPARRGHEAQAERVPQRSRPLRAADAPLDGPARKENEGKILRRSEVEQRLAKIDHIIAESSRQAATDLSVAVLGGKSALEGRVRNTGALLGVPDPWRSLHYPLVGGEGLTANSRDATL